VTKLKEGFTKRDWMEAWFFFRKVEGHPVDPRNMTEEEKKNLLNWMSQGAKYNYDPLKWIAEVFQNGRT